MAVQFCPPGYHSVTPYLIVDGATAALDFYKRALGAEELFRLPMGDKIGHAEFRIGDSILMISDEWPDRDTLGPKKRGGTTIGLMVYVQDVDAAFARALASGGVQSKPVEDQFYGDRSGSFIDPFGHQWTLGTHIEDVAPDEIDRRMQAMFGGG